MTRIACSITIGLIISRSFFPDSFVAKPDDGPSPWERLAGVLHGALVVPQRVAPRILGPVVRALHAEATLGRAKAVHREKSTRMLEATLKARGLGAMSQRLGGASTRRFGGLPAVIEEPDDVDDEESSYKARTIAALRAMSSRVSSLRRPDGSFRKPASGSGYRGASAISVRHLDAALGLSSMSRRIGSPVSGSPRGRRSIESSVPMDNVAGSGGLSVRSHDTTEPEVQSNEEDSGQIIPLPLAVLARSLVVPEMPSGSESKRCDDESNEATSTAFPAADVVVTVRMPTDDRVSPADGATLLL